MKGRWNDYQPEELAWIEAHKDLPRADLHRMFVARWGRPDVTAGAIKGLCKRKGWLTGRTGKFAPGRVNDNTAAQRMANHPNSVATRFKPGSAPANRVPLGSERVVSGYVEVKVAEPNPHTGHPTRFVQKHRRLWEQANGPVAEGHCLKCLDGDKFNTDPSNWEMIPRALLPRLNGRFGRDYDNASAEVKPAILTIAKLEHRARTARQKGAKDA